jgi:hypothetical protein
MQEISFKSGSKIIDMMICNDISNWFQLVSQKVSTSSFVETFVKEYLKNIPSKFVYDGTFLM